MKTFLFIFLSLFSFTTFAKTTFSTANTNCNSVAAWDNGLPAEGYYVIVNSELILNTNIGFNNVSFQINENVADNCGTWTCYSRFTSNPSSNFANLASETVSAGTSLACRGTSHFFNYGHFELYNIDRDQDFFNESLIVSNSIFYLSKTLVKLKIQFV